jgi:hypothetical protein
MYLVSAASPLDAEGQEIVSLVNKVIDQDASQQRPTDQYSRDETDKICPKVNEAKLKEMVHLPRAPMSLSNVGSGDGGDAYLFIRDAWLGSSWQIVVVYPPDHSCRSALSFESL